ncbi:MAG: class I SAM-dependent methyltransferase [Pseudomonadota bacterium]|nr:class I SAM-dependent methyltransferase [Pseudomonadota bacterium]
MKQWLTARWPFSIEAGVNRAYARSLARHGPSPQGVFWNSAKSQTSRFAALLAAIRRHRATTGNCPVPPAIADIGCGYGALLDYLSTHEAFAGWRYLGLDINPAMIRACHERFPGSRASFRVGGMPPEPVDYALFSGTFNLCMIDDAERWRGYILESLQHCRPVCRSGMVVNLLCRRRMTISSNIFYADREDILDRLRNRFGRVEAFDTPGQRHDVTFLIAE